MSNTIQASDLEFTPTGEGLGLEVSGLSLSDEPTEEVVKLLKLKLAESGVLIFRDQEVSEQEQLGFTRCFGETQGHPLPGVGGSNPNSDADPEVHRVLTEKVYPRQGTVMSTQEFLSSL